MPVRTLLLYAHGSGSETLSYQHGWPRHFAKHDVFSCDAYDLALPRDRRRLRLRLLLSRRGFEAVVLLHSVFSNGRFLPDDLVRLVARAPAPKAFFVGNEYKLMPEKIAFAEALGVRLLVTQLSSPAAHELYRRRLDCAVVYIPYTGLDEELFFPGPPLDERPIDLGYRAYDAPLYLGHDERRRLADRFAGSRLRVDISLDPDDRLDEHAWPEFLRSCRGQLGSEAGGDYFELTDELRRGVNAFLAEHPHATFADVQTRFLRDYPAPVSGRALSGRVIEAAGTKTVLVLVEGDHGGFFRAGEHYIPLRRDLSNADEALEQLGDTARCEELVARAHEVATTELTYDALLTRFHEALTPLL